MTSRVAKKRRDERRNPPTVAPPPAARPPANRGTFRVAQANRQLASELPGIVRNSTRRPKDQGAAQRSPSPPALAQTLVPQSAAKKKPAPKTLDATPSQLSIEKDLPRCKKRPDGNKAKSGGGSGKSFVPWC